jgi:hypothetical protein
MVSLEFFIDIILPVDTVPETLPGVKDGRCVGLTTLPPTVVKSGCLNLVEPLGPVQRLLYLYLYLYLLLESIQASTVHAKRAQRVGGGPTATLIRNLSNG